MFTAFGTQGSRAASDLQSTCNLLVYIGLLNDHFTAKYLFVLVEHETLNQRVPGSSPGAPTK
jgi:hypothetical protein